MIKQIISKIICRIKGHDYPGYTFDCYHLYFCRRCHKEMFDRSYDELPTLPEDYEWDPILDDPDYVD